MSLIFFFQAEDGIRDVAVTGVQTCALPIYLPVLVRVHRTGVHVQVGIDLDWTDLQSLRLQEDANGRSADALPEARQNATRDDDIFHVKSRDWTIQRVRDKLCVKISRRAPEGHERPVNPLTDCR